jgi:hypothetical protein
MCYLDGMLKRILFAVLTLAATHVGAAETFVANLEPKAGGASSATGSATLVLQGGIQATYEITYSGLLGAEAASHIHDADRAIVLDLPLGSPKIGVWYNIDPFVVEDLRKGRLFILIHTSAAPAGELRGDLLPAPTPTEAATWGRLKALFHA